jgi:hypothetical protein
MSSTLAHKWYSSQGESEESGWVTEDKLAPVDGADDDVWLDFADEPFERPGEAVIVAISRRKLQSRREGDRDLLAGFTGEDSAPDITNETSEAIIREYDRL